LQQYSQQSTRAGELSLLPHGRPHVTTLQMES
jgi:hypothetical protein